MTERMPDERLAVLKRNAEIVASKKYKGWFNEVVTELEAERQKLTALTPHIYDAAMRLSHKSSGQSANETAFELVRILEGRRACYE